MAGVNVPLQAAEHYYLISEPVPGVHPLLPILRDPGNSAYIREEAGKIMVGLFEAEARPWGTQGIPQDFRFGEIPPDWERMYPHIDKAMRRVPCLLDTGIKLLFCGPESFTADHNYLMGEAPNLKNFYVAAGFNSLGILSGGGVGHVMSHWITEGRAPMDVWTVNLRRTHAWQNNDRYLEDRVVETLGIGYQDHWPFRQAETARGVKKSVLHDRVAAAGRVFRRVGRMGASELVCASGTSARRTATVGAGRTGSPTTRRSTPRCASGSACSSSPPSPS